MLYHLSYNKKLKYLTPKIPKQARFPEDVITPRICFSNDITKALSAGICAGTNKRIYVYTYDCDNAPQIYKPKIKEVFDVKLTNEVWIKEKVKTKLVGIIKPIKMYEPIGHKNYICNYFRTYPYDWIWVKKYL